jgi:hypothetical protein
MTTNTLTNLLPNLYADLDVVSRELVGLIPAVTLDASLARGKVGQTVYSPVAPANSSVSITPAMAVPSEADQVIGSVPFSLTKSKAVPFSWDGEEERGLNTGGGIRPVWNGQFAQALRVLTNEVEADLAALQSTFSRAYGSTTTSFGTAGDFTDGSKVLKILKDNGAPLSDNQLVINTDAGSNFLGKQGTYNTQGDNSILRQGVFQTVAGMDIRESGQIVSQTAGSFTSGTLTSAVRAKGAVSLVTTADYSAGLAAGDIITLAHESDAHKYVIQSVSSGAIVIQEPGLRTATAASGTVAITKVASTARNMAFNRSAIVLATRLPERPSAGDMAIDVTTITDPRSGLTFEVSVYPGYRKVRYEVALAWGVANVAPRHTALLLGAPV